MEYYEGNYFNVMIRKLPLCKECKTLYKYYDSSEERTRYLKKDTSGLIVVQAENNDIARKIIFAKQKEYFNICYENIQKALEWEFENNNDIIGISSEGAVGFLNRYFKQVSFSNENPLHDHYKLPYVGVYDSDYMREARTKLIESVCRKLNKSFKFNVKYKGRGYVIETPATENIKIGKYRDEIVLYEQFSFHINDHGRFSEWQENTIKPIELLKLPVSYKKLLDEWNFQKESKNFSAVVKACDYRWHDETRDEYYGVVEIEDGKLKCMNVSTVQYYNALTKSIKNADIKIFSGSFSLYMTKDFLFQHTKLWNCGNKLMFAIDHSATLGSIIDDRANNSSDFILKEIKRQLDSSDWSAYLLLNEVNIDD